MQQQCDANFNFSDKMDKDTNNNKKQTDPDINDNSVGHNQFGKMRRNKKTRYKNDDKVRHLTSAICDVIENDGQSLFTCPVCRDILYVPVTVDCGHTYCANCVIKLNNKCCECDSDIATNNSTNVLLQDVVTKWKEMRKTFKEQNGKLQIF